MATMNTSEKIPVTITVTTPSGAPAQFQGQPNWATSDATIITVVPAADGMSADVISVAEGSGARVTVSIDADLGDGVTTVTGVSEDIAVTQDPNSVASTINFAFGAPVPKNPTPPGP
jgi:hypothetical protein